MFYFWFESSPRFLLYLCVRLLFRRLKRNDECDSRSRYWNLSFVYGSEIHECGTT